MLKITKTIDDCNQICVKMKNNLKQIGKDTESIRLSIEMRSFESVQSDLDSIISTINTMSDLYGELSEL